MFTRSITLIMYKYVTSSPSSCTETNRLCPCLSVPHRESPFHIRTNFQLLFAMQNAPVEEGQYLILLTPPDPASAAERRAFDRCYKNGSLPQRFHPSEVTDLGDRSSQSGQDGGGGTTDAAASSELDATPVTTVQSGDPQDDTHPSARERKAPVPAVSDGRPARPSPSRGPNSFVGQTGGSSATTLGHVATPHLSDTYSDRRWQLYTMSVSMQQELPEREYRGTGRVVAPPSTFKMIVDTASNDSWVCGLGYRIAHPRFGTENPFNQGATVLYALSRVNGEKTPTMEFQGYLSSPQSLPEPNREKTVYVKHGYVGLRKSQDPREEFVPAETTLAKISYLDASEAFLVLAPDLSVISLNSWYKWGAKLRKASSMQFPFRFEVAIGVTREIHMLPMDGIVGFGTLNYQKSFPYYGRYGAPSLVQSLSSSVRPPDTGNDGTIMYFALRIRRTLTESSAFDNWIALNRWPLVQQVDWSAPILLSEIGVRKHMWSATIRKISVFLAGTQSSSSKRLAVYPDDDVADSDTIEVILDTGSAVSYVSPEFVEFLQKELFPTPENLGLSTILVEQDRTTNYPPFMVPMAQFALEKWYLELEFVGTAEESAVVQVPCDPFLATQNITRPHENTREGLIYSKPGYEDANLYWVLGVPFFQSVYVALHNPGPEKPYIQLAPQWAALTASHKLPQYQM
ncbi:hypothetical protein BD413DRAFT_674381 [Trametes elegans]|nr:hypothetical protein BD413DRAFT_674381 [Trametes elegans]